MPVLNGGPVPLTGNHPDQTERKQRIVSTLESYRAEAETNRRSGLNPRDDKWRDNLDLYWNRWDFSAKAGWQSKEIMPEVPSYVDRFAAALKEALVNSPEGFYTVVDPADRERDVADAVKRMTDVWLSRCGRNQTGILLGFPAVFEEQIKLGALMAMCASVTWKEDVPGGRVAVETVDPQGFWMDHTYRNLYRLRRSELDRHELIKMAKAKDSRGKPIWNLPEIEGLLAAAEQETQRRAEELTGTGQQVISPRVPIQLDEYIATVLDHEGKVIEEEGSLYVVANNQFLIRGPEKNPFWHQKDWCIYAPLITTPLSVYGRSYMEDFGSVAKTFNELTNLILDAVHVTALKSWAMVPGMLVNPEQMAEGLAPNKIFLLEEGASAKDFASALDLGTLDPSAIRVWESMKRELSEAAGINEIGLGQFAPKGRTSATEVMETQQSSSALIRSAAQSIETRFLDPMLDRVWQTGVQHMKRDDPMLRGAAGDTLYEALFPRRKELVSRTYTFQARGISTLIQKSGMLQRLMQVLQVIASNELLLKEFMMVADMKRLIELIFNLANIDMTKLQMSERERMMRQLTEPLGAAQEKAAGTPGQASPGGAGEVGKIVAMLGLGGQGGG